MLIKKIRSIHFFPVKGMQGFEKENCILQKNKLIQNWITNDSKKESVKKFQTI